MCQPSAPSSLGQTTAGVAQSASHPQGGLWCARLPPVLFGPRLLFDCPGRDREQDAVHRAGVRERGGDLGRAALSGDGEKGPGLRGSGGGGRPHPSGAWGRRRTEANGAARVSVGVLSSRSLFQASGRNREPPERRAGVLDPGSRERGLIWEQGLRRRHDEAVRASAHPTRRSTSREEVDRDGGLGEAM